MSFRPRSSLAMMVATAMAAVAGSLGSIDNFFANSILAPSNWQGGTGSKRSRRGSYKKPNPEGYAAHERDGDASRRPRFLRAAPSMAGKHTLLARPWIPEHDPNGNNFARDHAILVRGLARVWTGTDLRFDQVKATPHGRSAQNRARFAGTFGNGAGAGKCMRASMRRAEKRGDHLTASSVRSRLVRMGLPT